MLFAGHCQTGPRVTSVARASVITNNTSVLSRVISGGDASKFTLSAWIKRLGGDFGVPAPIFVANNVAQAYGQINFSAAGALVFGEYVGRNFVCTSAGTVTDSDWHHIVVAYDNAQTGTSKLRMYIDGVPQSYSGTPSGPMSWFLNGYTHYLGGHVGGAWDDAYCKLSEVYLVEGVQAQASDFGAGTPGVVGQWLPKRYTATTLAGRSFWLPFDGSSIESVCQDKSGLGNHWTPAGMTLAGNWSADHP